MKLFTRLKNITHLLFTKHLFITNTSLGIFFFGAADVVQQQIEKRLYEGKTFDTRRTGSMLLSATAIGVAGHLWYSFLDRRFPGTSGKQVGKKIILEMAVGPPIFLAFFIAVGLLEGRAAKESFEQFKKNFLLVLAADWGVYAPLQAVNFFYLPPRYRFLYVCALCFVYDIFLSYILHKEDNKRMEQIYLEEKHSEE